MDKLKQIALSCWAVASLIWYVHQFSPALTPILRGILHRLWP